MKIFELKDAQITSGGKAFGLAYLVNNKIPVPKGFVIEDSENVEFSEKNRSILTNFLNGLDKRDCSIRAGCEYDLRNCRLWQFGKRPVN